MLSKGGKLFRKCHLQNWSDNDSLFSGTNVSFILLKFILDNFNKFYIIFILFLYNILMSVPTITSITPNVGSVNGNTTVTITGTSFLGTTRVTFGGTNALSYIINSSTQITCSTPANAVTGPVNVVVTNPGGSATSANGFTYFSTPTITTISPNRGTTNGNTTVTITGTNFTGTTGVTFGGTNATSYIVDSNTQITCVTPSKAAGSVNVVVAKLGVSVTSINGFTYFVPPTITSITPNVGSVNGNTTVTIRGSNFIGVTGVTFGGAAATSITVPIDSEITCRTPVGTAGQVDVVVTATGGSTTRANGFTYISPPTITGISPNAGTTSGGTTVTITGTNFTGTTGITFGGNAATNISVVSSTEITCRTPVGSQGLVNVVVTNPGGSVTFISGFTYITTPTIITISPITGSTNGGTTVTLTGTSFAGTTSVTFGGINATSYTVNSNTQITCVTPSRGAGSVNVVVTNPVNPVTFTNGFTYIIPPTITSITPNAGSVSGNTLITIRGTNFAVSSVTFGGANATNISVVSSTEITCRTPVGTVGPVNVVVTKSGVSDTAVNGFTYISTPTITSILPNSGSTNGGTTVILTGTSFAGTTSVTFGGTNVTSYTVVSNTQITCVTPSRVIAGQVNVVVTNPVNPVTFTNGFTYINAPTITSILPNSGSTNGGTTVIIIGNNFTGVTSVTFDDTNSTSYTVNSSTQITCVTPSRVVAGSVNLVVTNPGGSATLGNGFTYVNPPTITSILPNKGAVNGGTGVIITGTNFTSVTSVTFGVTNATSYTVNSPTQITCVTPANAVDGPVNVVITNPGGSSTLGNGFTYVNPPTITSILPNSGNKDGGTTVIITGTNFTGTTSVTFNNVPATSFTVISETQIDCVAPPSSAGLINVVVTTANGSYNATNAFTYNIICFKQDSAILTDKGYIPIQELRNGDLVKTVSSGFKKIQHIGYSKMYHNVNEIRSNDKLYKCCKTEYPELTEDLVITGCHSILVKSFKDHEQMEKTQEVLGRICVTEKYYRLPACVDDRTQIFEEEGVHTIWHFSLESSDYYMNYGVYANGLLVETTSNRMMVELSGMTLI
jgi:hypothetical protein